MEEKFGKFKDILFTEKGHTYTRNGNSLISVTTLLKKYQEPFDAEKWAMWSALKASGHQLKIWQFKPDEVDYTPLLTVSVDDIKKEWNLKKKEGTEVGSLVHLYLEGLFNRKVLNLHSPYERWKILKEQAWNFYQDYKDRYIPVKLEAVVANEFSAGQIDALFWDKELRGLVIIDYKTDKEIKYENRYNKFKSPLEHLDDCNFNKYSLQTSCYKKMLEDAIDEPVLETKIVWFNKDNENYQIIEPKLLTEEVELIWQQYQRQLVD